MRMISVYLLQPVGFKASGILIKITVICHKGGNDSDLITANSTMKLNKN